MVSGGGEGRPGRLSKGKGGRAVGRRASPPRYFIMHMNGNQIIHQEGAFGHLSLELDLHGSSGGNQDPIRHFGGREWGRQLVETVFPLT